jgi:hypothetical protein
MTEKAGCRPRRFDVAGAHPDEAYRAVANIYEVMKEIRKACIESDCAHAFKPNAESWMARKPLRFGNAPDAEVQQFLAEGVKLIDELLPFGFSSRQYEVRKRCDELAKSMERVLAKRPDERFQFDPRYASWRHVEIYA